MSIESLGGVYGPPGLFPRTPGPEGSSGAIGQKPLDRLNPEGSSRPGTESAGAVAASGLPAEAPPGTDPDLWSVLTAEERVYFARAKALGPVTYSPSRLGLAELGLQRGGRLDVKV